MSFCVLASTTDNKVGEEKKPSTLRTSTGTELTTVFLNGSGLLSDQTEYLHPRHTHCVMLSLNEYYFYTAAAAQKYGLHFADSLLLFIESIHRLHQGINSYGSFELIWFIWFNHMVH